MEGGSCGCGWALDGQMGVWGLLERQGAPQTVLGYTELYKEAGNTTLCHPQG